MSSESSILHEHVPMLRDALRRSLDPRLQQAAAFGHIEYLVEEKITQNTLDIYEFMGNARATRAGAPNGTNPFRKLREFFLPFLNKVLLRASVRTAACSNTIHLDPVAGTIVHIDWGIVPSNQSSNYSAEDPSTWLNMHLEWPKTIEEDSSYRNWLMELFPELDGFFDTSYFETNHSLYQCTVEDSLLEHALFRGIPPALFGKQDLNEALQSASQECFGHAEAKWFHVNVHDNLQRVVEQFGRYDFAYPLEPLFLLINHHRAREGGTTYAGIGSADREWCFLIQDGLHLVICGPQRFVALVLSKLRLPT